MMREAITLHVKARVEHGELLPEPRSSLESAVACHEKTSGECDEENLARFTDTGPALPTTYGLARLQSLLPPWSERTNDLPPLPRLQALRRPMG